MPQPGLGFKVLGPIFSCQLAFESLNLSALVTTLLCVEALQVGEADPNRSFLQSVAENTT